MKLAEVNQLALQAFVARFGGVFEHSPWVAEKAWAARPFKSVEALHEAMQAAVREAKPEAQRALLCAHPELAGAEAADGTLTTDSSSEQGRLGFIALPREEFLKMARVNRAYREKFGFPCIVALRLHRDRRSVMDEMERRLSNDCAAEIENALGQVGHIARGRLAKLFGEH